MQFESYLLRILHLKCEIYITVHQSLNETYHLEYPGLYGRIILRWIFRKWDEGIDWIDLA
jgi:hypothetical protein